MNSFSSLQADDLILRYNLGSQFEQPDITAFIPSSEVLWKFKNVQSQYGYNLDDRESVTTLMLYHIGKTSRPPLHLPLLSK